MIDVLCCFYRGCPGACWSGWRGGLVIELFCTKPSDYANDYSRFDMKKHLRRGHGAAKA